MKKRLKINKDRHQLAFELDAIMTILEDSFIKKLQNFFAKLTNKILKLADNLDIFKKSIDKTDKKDIIELKNLFRGFYKKVGKESVKKLNEEIKVLSGASSKITIPDINEGLRYRAEVLALKKLKDFKDTIVEKIKASEGSIKDKKDLIKTVKSASKLFANRNVKIVARMESVNAVNTARIEAGMKSAIVKGFQFLAILDKRTTQICRARHGKVLKKDDPRVTSSFRPPCHWGCRSLLSPVTIFEDIPFTNDYQLNSIPSKDFGKTNDTSLDQSKIENDFFGVKKINEVNNLKELSDKELLKVVKEQEKRIIEVSENKYEIMSGFDKFGNILVTKKGNRTTIDSFTNEEKEILIKQAKIITHNHPNGSSFSPNDLNVAYQCKKLVEIRAISNNIKGVFSLKDFNKIDKSDFIKIQSNYFLFTNTLQNYLNKDIIDIKDINITSFSNSLMMFFKIEYNLKYSFIKED